METFKYSLNLKALLVLLCFSSTTAFANNQEEFCQGFAMGYKTAYGNNNIILPICPIAPITPIGSTPYQEGLKEGAKQGAAAKN